ARVAIHGFDRFGPRRDMRIMLIEAANRIMPSLPEHTARAAYRSLDQIGTEHRMGFKVIDGTGMVEAVDPLGKKLLPFVLSTIAGSVDVIGFLGMGGLFIAH